ncbi:MAG: hypothetical protein JNK23_09825 [Opitutaceae bacterium]|nr:hypothetical protein [Opitutaceae bacterium]
MTAILYTFVLGALLWLVLMWLGARLRSRACPRELNLAFGVAAALLLCVPVDGLGMPSWMFGFCPNPSLPLIGVVCAGIWQRLGGLTVLRPADWTAAWIFGAVAGSALYLHPMLFGSLDLYFWGWDRAGAAWGLAALAAVFLTAGNRFGVLLLAALVGFACRALESANAWDYAIDPGFWLASLGALGWRGVRQLRARWSRVMPAAA